MKAPALRVMTALTAAAIASGTFHILVLGLTVLALLIYGGIGLPAVWSAQPTRRRAAAEVLRQILGHQRHHD